MSAIEVRDLRKSYDDLEAVSGVSFEVGQGEVVCLLGPNGAGKTTITEILEGYRTRSAGEAARALRLHLPDHLPRDLLGDLSEQDDLRGPGPLHQLRHVLRPGDTRLRRHRDDVSQHGDRDRGAARRRRAQAHGGTPLPGWAYVAARIISTLIVTVAMSALTLVIGHFVYDTHVRGATLGGLIVTLALGSATFTALGVGLVRCIKNAEAAPAVLNATILPLTFISGIWFHFHLSTTLTDIAQVFPVRALADGLQHAFNPFTRGSGFESTDLLTLAIWLAIGIFAMIRFLRQPERV